MVGMIRRALAALAAAALLAGCTGSTDPSEPTVPDDDPTAATPGDYEELAQSAVEALAAGDAVPLHELFSQRLAAQLSQEDLADIWEQTTAPAGEYLGTSSVESSDRIAFTVVNVTSEFRALAVIAQLTFGEDGELEGLYFSYGEAQGTEHPDPLTLPEGATELELSVGELELPGKLVLPAAEGPAVVVLLVAGSGPSDMDGTVGTAGNAVLRDMAYLLAESGIPTLRYDKRFHAKPELATDASTIEDEVLDDVSAAIALLGETDEVAGRDIVVLGHSLGGMLLPAIASENPEVAGGVIVAGTARSLWDVIADQNADAIEAALEAGAMTEAEADKSREEIATEIARANALTDSSEPAVLGVLPAAYVVSLNELRLPELAASLDIPLLVLQGEHDFQISAGVDFESWRPVLSGNPDVTYELFAGLNHLMMPVAERIADVTVYNDPSAVAPEVSETITAWLAGRY